MKWIKLLAPPAVLLILFYLYAFGGMFLEDRTGKEHRAAPVGIDYAMYYAAGELALSGDAEAAYDQQAHNAVMERVLRRGVPGVSWWVYPPSFLLVIAPLALLPYEVSYAVWMLLTLALLYFALRKLCKNRPHAAWIALSCPALMLVLRWGQNAFLSAALLAFALDDEDERPVLSGVFLGLLCFKPQIAVFPLFVLLLRGRWKTLLSAAASAAGAVLLSGALFGFGSWLRYAQTFFGASANLLGNAWGELWAIQPTFYSFFRLQNLGSALTAALTLLAAALSVLFVLWVVRRTQNRALRASALVLGMLLALPYYILYDYMLLAIPLALLIADFAENGCKPHEIILLALQYLLPFASWVLATVAGVLLGPLALLPLLFLLLSRVSRQTVAQGER